MLFKDLFDLYYERHAKTRTQCPENAYYFFKTHGPRWANVDVESISRVQVQDWVDHLGVKSQSAATRAANMMSAVINWGIKRGHVFVLNPCTGVEKFTIQSRERFILPDEMIRFRDSLDQESELLRDFFWICLLTGARRGNVLEMKWSQVDFTLQIWRIPKAKNGESHLVPLAIAALAILQRRLGGKQGEWVFPGEGGTGHLVEPKRAWKRVLKRAKIEDLRIHDLRRTLGSYLAIKGASTYIIGKALGHKDQRSTAVYARLHLDPVRKAVEDAHSAFF